MYWAGLRPKSTKQQLNTQQPPSCGRGISSTPSQTSAPPRRSGPGGEGAIHPPQSLQGLHRPKAPEAGYMTVLSPKQMGAYLEAAQRRELLPMFYMELVSELRKGDW